MNATATLLDRTSGLNFSQLVGLVNEPNMCSGGTATLRTILRQAPTLHATDRALEVGSNTGFAVLELAAQTPATVHGIDIEPASVALAQAKAAALGLDNARFQVGDGTRIDFPDDYFSLVFVSNVTSFIPQADRAVADYYRVLRPLGTLAAVPIYYHRPPPAALVAEVEAAIGAPIRQRSLDDWLDLFGGQPYFIQEYEYEYRDDHDIDRYVARVLGQPSNDALDEEVKQAAGDRLRYFYALFNENLQYARYAIVLLRKGAPTGFPILHTSRRVTDER